VARKSIGALAIALVMVWLTQSAWAAAWEPDDDDHSGRPDVPFRF
jgi:hypothetical protein